MNARFNDVLLAGGVARRQSLLVGLLGSVALGLTLIALPLGFWSVVGLPFALLPFGVVLKSAAESASGERRMIQKLAGAESQVGKAVSRLDEANGQLLRVEQQIDEAEARLSLIPEMERRLDVELRTLKRDVHALKKESGATKVRSVESVAELARVEARLARIKESLSSRLERTSETADGRHREVSRRIDREREERHRATAARDSTGRWPNRILLQMTINRTGSTRLFDVLRCHSDVYVEPLDFIWRSLGLAGRRYPVGLSDGKEKSTSIVSQGSIGVGIRSMRAPIAGMPDPATGHVAVEKAHPQFFDFDVERFVDAIDAVSSEHSVEIDIVYQIRNPLDVMWSMAEYKQRDPTWHGQLTIEGIPALVRGEFEALQFLLRAKPGLVIDYEDVNESSPVMMELARLVSRASSEADCHRWLQSAFAATSRSGIVATDFVGQRQDRVADGPENMWRPYVDDLVICEAIYRRLVDFR